MIDLSGCGYLGGLPCASGGSNAYSFSGESYIGKGLASSEQNGGGGGGGQQNGQFGSIGGGGGGYGSPRNNSDPNTYSKGNRPGGKGGSTFGADEIKVMYMGSGGGAGSPYSDGQQKGKGGNGGGLILIVAREFTCEGKILANGGDGENALENTYGSGGGGGSGGSIKIYALLLKNKGQIFANSGRGGNWGNKANAPETGSKGGNGRCKIVEDFSQGKKLAIHGLNIN